MPEIRFELPEDILYEIFQYIDIFRLYKLCKKIPLLCRICYLIYHDKKILVDPETVSFILGSKNSTFFRHPNGIILIDKSLILEQSSSNFCGIFVSDPERIRKLMTSSFYELFRNKKFIAIAIAEETRLIYHYIRPDHDPYLFSDRVYINGIEYKDLDLSNNMPEMFINKKTMNERWYTTIRRHEGQCLLWHPDEYYLYTSLEEI